MSKTLACFKAHKVIEQEFIVREELSNLRKHVLPFRAKQLSFHFFILSKFNSLSYEEVCASKSRVHRRSLSHNSMQSFCRALSCIFNIARVNYLRYAFLTSAALSPEFRTCLKLYAT